MTPNEKSIEIADIMRPIITIKRDATLRAALEHMICERTNSLIVVDEAGKFVGIVNALHLIKQVVPDYLETDELAAHFANEDLFKEDVAQAADVKVIDFMDSDAKTLKTTDGLMQAAISAISGSPRVPVLDDAGVPIGVLTRTELKQVIGIYLGIDKCFEK